MLGNIRFVLHGHGASSNGFGLPGVTGVMVLDGPANSVLAKGGLQKGDVVLSIGRVKTADAGALLQQAPVLADAENFTRIVLRRQNAIALNIKR